MIKRQQVWKLQRPLRQFGYTGGQMILAYTKGKKQIMQIPANSAEIVSIFGDKPKLYVKAEMVDGMLKVKKQIKDQDW